MTSKQTTQLLKRQGEGGTIWKGSSLFSVCVSVNVSVFDGVNNAVARQTHGLQGTSASIKTAHTRPQTETCLYQLLTCGHEAHKQDKTETDGGDR